MTSDVPEPSAIAPADGDSGRLQPTLGRRLKALRVSRGLSLKEVAGKTGLSASFLSMVETGRNEMTVGRLVTMADFYEVGLGDLIPAREMEQPVVLRRDDRLAFDSPDHRVTTEQLSSWHHGEMTSGLVRFDVGAELTEAVPQAGPKFVLVLVGELAIEFADDASVALAEGDSVWFEASRRHRLVNVGEGEASMITFRGSPRPDQG
ncbi:MAG: XRE family transcriptional regulator [Solirubrobacterales bacterium]